MIVFHVLLELVMTLEESIKKELIFKTSRSSGPGGQHVNKTSSRVEAIFDLKNSKVLDDEQKELLRAKLESHIDSKGLIHVVSSEHRSQLRNKSSAIFKMYELIITGIIKPKKRKATKPSRKSIEARLRKKSLHALKKGRRKNNSG